MLRYVSAIVLILVLSAYGPAQTTHTDVFDEPKAMMSPCSDCHVCTEPTMENPCLKPCPRHDWKMTSEHREEEGPDLLVLDDLANLYTPVKFSHRQHAHWTKIGEGCSECHHYSPAGLIPPCSECHTKEINPKNLRQVGLKGAYHQHCMGCHQEWSLSNDCNFCHAKIGPDGQPTALLKVERGLVAEPDKKVYHTDVKEGPVVTFFHREHTQLYGVDCMECHRGKSCGICHTPYEKRAGGPPTPAEIHSRCFGCHKDDACTKCHGQEELPRFSHAKTGWALNRFHQPLSCNDCHPKGQRVSRLDPTCTACHKDWNASTFAHGKITGVTLGETHAALDCGDCHQGKKFDVKPSCAGCHEGYAYPKEKPEI